MERVGLKEACTVHGQRPAVGRCARCNRAACLSCAIPVRARVFCTECVGTEIGAPVARRVPEPQKSRGDIAMLGLFLLGIGATFFPWDRFGDRTGAFSAWNPFPEPWPLLASLSLLAGGILTFARTIRRDGPSSRALSLWNASAGGVALAASTAAIVAVPGHATRTFWPIVALAAALGATIVIALRLRHRAA